ncbi:MAG TPA: ABC transporter permease [Pyrinomonadaceae bacterium]|jgi:putative ABC transport system permease protein
METLLKDIRYGLRMIGRSPGFTIIAVLALALGIGANTAIFSVVNSVLLRALPYEQQEQLVMVWGTHVKRGTSRNPASYPDFADFRDQNQVFEHMAAYTQSVAILTGQDAPEQLSGVAASGDLFAVLRARAERGRVFTPEDERPESPRVAVISYGLWQRRFAANPQLVGQQIMLDGVSRTVIGIMPQGFTFPLEAQKTEYWLPINPSTELNRERGAHYLGVIARLKPGVSLQQAQTEMATVASRIEQQYPDKNSGRGVSLISMYEQVVGDIRPALLILLGAVGFVLLIACANVANLLLARAAARQKEIAIRSALGANRARIIRQLLTESVLLSVIGGLLGLLLALWGLDLMVAVMPADLPRVKEIGLDARVLSFTLLVSVMTGLVFGLAPALQASRQDLNESLKEGGRGSSEGIRRNRLRSLLVVSQVALSLVLLTGAGLLIRSFKQLHELNPGFDPYRVLTAGVALPDAKYHEDERMVAFFQQALQQASSVPGVEAVGAVYPLPLSGDIAQNLLTVEGRPPLSPGERLTTNSRIVSANYFRAMGIPLIKGRVITERDTKDAPRVVVINETLARKYFPGEEPLGKRINVTLAENNVAEIVGVVGDVKHMGLERESGPESYFSYQQIPLQTMTLIARSRSENPAELAAGLRQAVERVDSDQPLSDVRTMEQLLADSLARRRFNMLLLGLFSGLALLLAGVGIFGVMNYSVMQRTHEIGIRMALGAQAGDILKMVLGQGMLLTLVGVAIGLGAAFWLTRFMAGLLYGVTATDPLTFGAVAVVLGLVALLAIIIPARRATKVDPIVALRYE